jgi:hypothetical protein
VREDFVRDPERRLRIVPMRLRDATNLATAALGLRQCAQDAMNIANSSAGQGVVIQRNNFLAWLDRAEIHLRGVFLDPGAWEGLYSERYWQIYNLGADAPRAMELINKEANERCAWLNAHAQRLDALAARVAAAPGQMTVLDSHVLLHFEPPDKVDWPEILGAAQVRLILPLRVIEEIDEKKYTKRSDLADRARRLLSQLRAQLALSAGGPTQIREHVTIEVPIDDGPRHRSLDADQEILETCEELRSVGQPVVLVTDDTGISLRALARRLNVVSMPEKYLRVKPVPSEQDRS